MNSKIDCIISETEICKCMEATGNKVMGQQIVFYKTTDSTNSDVGRLAKQGAKEGTLVVADMQESGRGRRGRTWISLPGEAVYMSLLLRPCCNPDKVSPITLVMALSVAEAIEELQPEDFGIKWPNDIVINGKKICGILTEMNMSMEETGKIDYVVVGVGINVNQSCFPQEISQTATSLAIEIGHKINRCELIARIMHYFERNYMVFEVTNDLTGLQEKYNGYLLNCKKEVRILDPKGEYEATAIGIDSTGELLVRKKDGKNAKVYAGEVSVRGIYGYV